MGRYYLSACLAVFVLLALASASAFALGYLKIHPSNPHYFQEDGTGKPVLIASYWNLIPAVAGWDDIGETDYWALRRRLSWFRVWHSNNAYWDGCFYPWLFSTQTGACDGLLPNKFDLTTNNPTYWERLRTSFNNCALGGAYAELLIFDRCGMQWDWPRNVWNSNNNINDLGTDDCGGSWAPGFYQWQTKPNLKAAQETYIKNLIDGTIACPNVIYEIENEHSGYTSSGWADHYGQFIKDYISTNYPNSPRLVTYNSIVSHADLDQAYNWSCIDVVQPHYFDEPEYDPTVLNTYIEPRWSYNKAINVDEFGNNCADPNVMREMCWTIVSSGGHYKIEDALEESRPAEVCENIRSFLAKSGWNFINCAPQKSLITSGGGYCMRNPGVEYMCYFPTGGSKTITLSSATYNQKWWNPRTGGFYNLGSFAHGGGSKVLSTPDSNDWVLHLTTGSTPDQILQSKYATTAITIDGATNDWVPQQTKICGGNVGTGNIAIVDFDDDKVCYVGGNLDTGQKLPFSKTDHAAKISSRYDSSYVYFMIRCEDDDIRYNYATSANYLNDCVEFYIDPSNNGGAAAMSSSTSDVQLVIDANNQKNVYNCTSGYASQVLGGVSSAVVRDTKGWTLEVRLTKSVFDPDLPATGNVGIDFAFRDNDNANDAAFTTVTGWADPQVHSSTFPAKIPDRWGKLNLETYSDSTAPAAVTGFSATAGSGQVTLNWTKPSTGDFTGTVIRYKTGSYPSSVTDGALVVDKLGSPSGADSYVHTGLTGGVTYYYKAFAHDAALNYASAAQASATPSAVQVYWNTLAGDQFDVSGGRTPSIAIDSAGTIHLVYMVGDHVYYRTGNAALEFSAAEQIPDPAAGPGYYVAPHCVVDSSNVPHVVFEMNWGADSQRMWYTNRIGGSWKTPAQVMSFGGYERVNQPRLALGNGYAYAACFGVPEGSPSWAQSYIVRITNLSTTPTVARAACHSLWNPHPYIKSNGELWICGRDMARGHKYCQLDNYTLGQIGSVYELSSTNDGITGEEFGACMDINGVIHGAGIVGRFSYYYPAPIAVWYNNSTRSASYDAIMGMDGGQDWGSVDVVPGLAVDTAGETYLCYRRPETTEGWATRIINNNAFDTPVAFGTGLASYPRNEMSVVPTTTGGVYVAWESGSSVHVRSVGRGSDAPDTTPPGPVSNFTATGGPIQVNLTWTNPSDSDFTGTMVRFKTTGYPTSTTDGTLVTDEPGSPGAADGCTHGNLTAGVTYYYSAWSHDSNSNYTTTKRDDDAVPTEGSSGPLGTLLIHSGNPHYFQEAGTGRPILIASVTAIVPTDTGYDYVNGIAQMGQRRISYARVWHFLPWSGSNAVWPWGRSSTPNAPMGGNKIDMNTWNTTYWDRMNDAFSRASDIGTYAEIMLFDRCGLSPAASTRYEGNPWASDNNINSLEMPTAVGNDGTPDFYYYSSKPNLKYQQERYIKKMIDETIDYPNTFYEIENEHWQHNDPDWASHYAAFVKSYIATNYPTKPKLVSYNSLETDLESCYSITNLDVVNVHFGNEAESDPSVLNDYLESHWTYNKAMNVDEFANGVTSPALLREMCWTIITSGGNFHIEDATDASHPFDICENIRSFIALSGWDFAASSPDSSLVASGAGYCMKKTGAEYVCYFPTGGNKTVNLTAGTYRQEWWDPATGGFYSVSSFSHGGGNKAFTCPDSSDWVLHVTTASAPTTTLTSKGAGTITIDGASGDWSLGAFTTKICGGNVGAGDIAVVDFDTNGVCYVGGHLDNASLNYYQVVPSSATDHAVKIYSRNDSTYLYFLIRVDDSDMQYGNPTSANWANDCVEFYIDPGNDGGATGISNSSSDLQLVIDANNQKNVYMTTTGYASQVLAGVTSAVVRDGTGWWLEARLQKSVFDPDIPATGTIGIDFCFRDNDNNNETALTTVTSWHEPEISTSFPTKIPNRWGKLTLETGGGGGDTTPPGNVTSFTATAGDTQNSLSWTNPGDGDFAGTRIMFKTTGYPTGPTDGTQCYSGTGTSTTHSGLTNGVTYYYKAFAFDGVPNYASGAQASATPVDVTAPGSPTSFTATAGVQQVSLSWTNPTAPDFAGTQIRFKTGSYPTGPTDGTQIYNGSGTSATHTGLTAGVTYYYCAYAYDDVPNYSTAAQANATPTAPSLSTVNTKSAANMNLVIDGSSSDWTLGDFTVKSLGGQNSVGDYAIVGFDGGVCYYGGRNTNQVLPTSASDHTAKVYSRHDQQYQYFLIRCDDDQMNYAQPASANWANDCVEFYIDPSHNHGATALTHPGTSTSDMQLVIDCNNQKNAYCVTSGYASQVLAGVTSAVVRDGTGWWLEAKILKSAIDPDLPASGSFGVDFCFRDNDNPDATYYAGSPAYSTMYGWRETPSGTGFPYKVPDAWGDASLATLSADTTAPASVTSFTATPSSGQNALAWTNPQTADWAGTQIRFKTTGYPTGPTDGTQIYNGTGTSHNHGSLTNGVTYYYCAYAYDEVPNHATAAQANATPTGSSLSIINTKSAANMNLVIDGGSSDWALGDFTTKSLGGQNSQGDYAIVGFDGGTCYYGGYNTALVLPTSATDHTAKVYSRHDQQYMFFLIRCDDAQMNYAQPASANWANDCVEFYIDPGHNHGATGLTHPGSSTSDLQLVIDANNQKNVYCCDSTYATQVLNGVTSAVVRDGTGWWLEVMILKSAIDPDLPASGSFGVDFCFRDNDDPDGSNIAGNPATSTMYGWRMTPSGTGYPYKVPDTWGDASLATLSSDTTAPASVTGFSGTPSSGQVALAWTNPATHDWAGTQIRFKTTGYPTGPTDGTQIYNGTGASYAHTGLTASTIYYYCAYAYDEVPNYATAAQANATTPSESNPPTFVAAGTVEKSADAITPGLPAGLQTNDILLLLVETRAQAISVANSNGGTWTQVTSSPQSTSNTRLTVFWSRYNGTQGAPTTSDSGNHQMGQIIAIRGATTSGNPWDVTAGGVESTSDTSGSIPGATTTVANTLVVAVIATDLPDANTTGIKFSGWSNGNLTSLTERTDETTYAGDGGGLAIATGVKATAGAYGNTAVTLANTSPKAMMSIAIKP